MHDSKTKATCLYIEQVLAEKLYDAAHQTVQPPSEEHMHDISYALNTPYLVQLLHISIQNTIYSITNTITTKSNILPHEIL